MRSCSTMSDCRFEEYFLPDTPETTFGDETLRNFDFEVKFDLECHGQSPRKTIGILPKVFHTFGPNLVILVLKRLLSYRPDKHFEINIAENQ